MRVLLTNDDGIHAPGLEALCRELSAMPELELYVVAPDRERSASGHAITLHKPLYAQPARLPGSSAPAWSINGTPADCTKIGISALMPSPPELVISGINRGANLGINVLYSGTVSAAIEGVLLGVPSLAVSLAALDQGDFTPAARFVGHFLKLLIKRGNPGFRLLNINVPDRPLEAIRGVAVTRLSNRRYVDSFVRRTDPRGRTYYWLSGELEEEDRDPATDAGALHHGFISVTPLHLNLTDTSLMDSLGQWRPELDALFLRSDPPSA